MRLLLFSLIVFCSSCGAIEAELQNAIAYGEIQELNEFSPDIDKQLFIRLYQAPEYKENCFKETHGVCQYKYFLSVSTFDEYPQTNIYTLKTIGEVVDVKWSFAKAVDTALIDITMSKYTAEALKNNKGLVNTKTLVHLVITPARMSESLAELSN